MMISTISAEDFHDMGTSSRNLSENWGQVEQILFHLGAGFLLMTKVGFISKFIPMNIQLHWYWTKLIRKVVGIQNFHHTLVVSNTLTHISTLCSIQCSFPFQNHQRIDCIWATLDQGWAGKAFWEIENHIPVLNAIREGNGIRKCYGKGREIWGS